MAICLVCGQSVVVTGNFMVSHTYDAGTGAAKAICYGSLSRRF